MRFDWDPAKVATNQIKHGISFEQAITAFDDPLVLVESDAKHSTPTEKRERWISQSDAGYLVVVYTQRGTVTRIISARRANRREKALYEASQG